VFFNVRGGYKAINRVPILLPRDVFLFDVQRTASSSADVFLLTSGGSMQDSAVGSAHVPPRSHAYNIIPLFYYYY
jgi:hypothetical protein